MEFNPRELETIMRRILPEIVRECVTQALANREAQPPQQEWFTPKEAAHFLGYKTTKTLTSYVKSGKIPEPLKMGKRGARFHIDDLRRLRTEDRAQVQLSPRRNISRIPTGARLNPA